MTIQVWQPIEREIEFDDAKEQAHVLLIAGGQNITFALKGKVGSVSFVDDGAERRLRVCEAVEGAAVSMTPADLAALEVIFWYADHAYMQQETGALHPKEFAAVRALIAEAKGGG